MVTLTSWASMTCGHFSVQVSDAHYEGLEGAQTIPEINLIVNNDASYFHNHSCDPNCWFSAANSSTMVARRDIKPGEEITFDYGLQESADFPGLKIARLSAAVARSAAVAAYGRPTGFASVMSSGILMTPLRPI